jgi:surface antigen
MKQEDLKALSTAARSALDTKQDGESMEWSNKGTGNSVHVNGTITPTDTTKNDDRTCRKLTIVAQAKGQMQTWVPTVCKTGTGSWAVLKR